MPVIPASVATTPPTISMIALFVGEPVKTRETSLLTELNACPPKYSSNTPPTISAIEIAFAIECSLSLVGESVGDLQALVHPAWRASARIASIGYHSDLAAYKNKLQQHASRSMRLPMPEITGRHHHQGH
jgi:hypothetical protein